MAEAEESSQAVKRTLIVISSSSSSSSAYSEEDNALESDSESYNTSSESKSEDSVEEISSSTSCDDEEDDRDCFDEYDEKIEEESICGRVVNLIREKNDLQELTLVDCKAYLRIHGLRLSGTRAECILRIQDHWRLKDGIGETLYPRSSFTINCTGDVCRGDVVLFIQNVYRKFDKVTSRGSPLGKRTIAGRIVKESYGAVKQQHTFTIEVLWSTGIKKLPPVFPLLVKGRNLYRLQTYRQPWENENTRSKVLAEKHRRGAAARSSREMRRTKAAAKRRQKIDSTKESTRKRTLPHMQGDSNKRQKRFHQHSISPQMNEGVKKDKHADKHGKTPVGDRKRNYYHQKVPVFGWSNLEGTRKRNPHSSCERHRYLLHSYEQEFVSHDRPPGYVRPQYEWRHPNDLAGLRTNNTSQTFYCKAGSSRRRN